MNGTGTGRKIVKHKKKKPDAGHRLGPINTISMLSEEIILLSFPLEKEETYSRPKKQRIHKIMVEITLIRKQEIKRFGIRDNI